MMSSEMPSAKYVVPIDDDVTNIDAYTKLDTALFRNTRVALKHGVLDISGASNRINRTGEFSQDAVACCLHDTAAMR